MLSKDGINYSVLTGLLPRYRYIMYPIMSNTLIQEPISSVRGIERKEKLPASPFTVDTEEFRIIYDILKKSRDREYFHIPYFALSAFTAAVGERINERLQLKASGKTNKDVDDVFATQFLYDCLRVGAPMIRSLNDAFISPIIYTQEDFVSKRKREEHPMILLAVPTPDPTKVGEWKWEHFKIQHNRNTDKVAYDIKAIDENEYSGKIESYNAMHSGYTT